MADEDQADLTEEESAAFVAKLEAWGEGLDAREKRALSALVGVALSTRDDDGVQGYAIYIDFGASVLGDALAQSRLIDIGIGEKGIAGLDGI